MKCTDTQKYLDDYLDGTMPAGEQKAVDDHIEHCSSCQQALQQHQNIRQTLRSLPVEEASLNFEANVFAAVRSQHGTVSQHSDNRFFAGFSTALVAGLALWFASTVYTPQFDGEITENVAQVIKLEMNQARTVKLVFDVPTELADVTLRVELPDNVELEGYSGQKQLVWQTKLNKGQNILALPVIATGDGQGELVAQLNYGDKTKLFYIVLKTARNGALIYQINKFKSA